MDADCKINTCSRCCLMHHFPRLHLWRTSCIAVYFGSQVSYTNMGNRDVSLAITLSYQMEVASLCVKNLSKILSQTKIFGMKTTTEGKSGQENHKQTFSCCILFQESTVCFSQSSGQTSALDVNSQFLLLTFSDHLKFSSLVLMLSESYSIQKESIPS